MRKCGKCVAPYTFTYLYIYSQKNRLSWRHEGNVYSTDADAATRHTPSHLRILNAKVDFRIRGWHMKNRRIKTIECAKIRLRAACLYSCQTSREHDDIDKITHVARYTAIFAFQQFFLFFAFTFNSELLWIPFESIIDGKMKTCIKHETNAMLAQLIRHVRRNCSDIEIFEMSSDVNETQ